MDKQPEPAAPMSGLTKQELTLIKDVVQFPRNMPEGGDLIYALIETVNRDCDL